MRLDLSPIDVRSAARALLAGRWLTLTAVLSRALGIATNTTTFSVFDAMFLRPLPFPDAGQLIRIDGRQPETRRAVSLTLDDARTFASTLGTLHSVAAHAGRTSTLLDGGDPERIDTRLVTASLFPMLDQQPRRGRGFADSEDPLDALRHE